MCTLAARTDINLLTNVGAHSVTLTDDRGFTNLCRMQYKLETWELYTLGKKIQSISRAFILYLVLIAFRQFFICLSTKVDGKIVHLPGYWHLLVAQVTSYTFNVTLCLIPSSVEWLKKSHFYTNHFSHYDTNLHSPTINM